MSLDVVITWSSNSHQTPAVILLFIHIYYNRGRFLGWFSTFLHQFPLKSIYITSCLFSGYITRVTHVDVTQLDFRRLSLWIIIWMPDFTNHPSTAAYIIKIPPMYILVYTFKCFRFQVFVRPNYKLFFLIMIFVPLKSSAWRSSMLFWFMFGHCMCDIPQNILMDIQVSLQSADVLTQFIESQFQCFGSQLMQKREKERGWKWSHFRPRFSHLMPQIINLKERIRSFQGKSC